MVLFHENERKRSLNGKTDLVLLFPSKSWLGTSRTMVLGTAIMTAVSLDSKRNTGGFPIMNKTSIGSVIAVLFGFCLILWAADAVGAGFGKIGENVALGVIAVLLVIGLIKARKEK